MSKTVVGLFSSFPEAQTVKSALESKGYDHVRVVANDDDETATTSSGTKSSDTRTTDTGTSGKPGIGDRISSFFSNLSGGDDDAHQHYATGVNSGGALLTATVPDNAADEVAALLKQHGARDIEGGYGEQAEGGVPVYGSGTVMASSATATGEQTIPIVEEELLVGKRSVDRGGVRVYSHITETPVDTDINLREERVVVERRPVNRTATAADFAAGRGAAIQVDAMGEEAVVGKSARVVEEVLVGKQASERTQAIHDSVRRTEVEVEQLEGESVKTGATGYTTDADLAGATSGGSTTTGSKTGGSY